MLLLFLPYDEENLSALVVASAPIKAEGQQCYLLFPGAASEAVESHNVLGVCGGRKTPYVCV